MYTGGSWQVAAGPVSSVAGTGGAWTRVLSATEPTTASTQPTNGTAVSVILAPTRINTYFWHNDSFCALSVCHISKSSGDRALFWRIV